ncbi:MAG: U32 family peptidase [Chitinispirillales bacterium]|jgi:putative protease|nr:U32 family peptidase [Chitinispirillales bacterium]
MLDTKKQMTPELLAPAGSPACAETAFAYGADAVYAGIGNFNLRAHSPNFTVEEFGELVDFADGSGRRVYGVLNIMPNDEQLAPLEDALRRLAGGGCKLPHAFIVSDPGVLSLVNDIFAGGVPIHLSTQNGCFNSESMKFWRRQGVSRVILPRELNTEQIRRLSSLDIMETEVFIHGAMCVSISGRCLLGAYYNRRHPNLGDCPQPCRLKYRVIPSDPTASMPHDGFDAEEGDGGVYLLNSKDLCTVGILPAIMGTGAVSFKIEGRNKSAHYVASVVKVYRDAIDTYIASPKDYKVKDWWISELDAIDHRPYTTGFYDDDPIKQELFASKAQAGCRLVGTVKAVIDGCPVIDVKNSFSAPGLESGGGAISILPVNRSQVPFDFTFDTVRELDGPSADPQRARSNRLVVLGGCSERLRVGDMLRVRV